MRQLTPEETVAKVVTETHLITDHKIKTMLPIYRWLHDNPPTKPNPFLVGNTIGSIVPVAQHFDQPDNRQQYRTQISLWHNGLFYVAHGSTLEQATEQMVLKLEFGDGHPPLEDKPVETGQGRLL